MSAPSGLYYPNRLARAFLLALEEVVGRFGTAEVLRLAALDAYAEQPPPDDMVRTFDIAHLAALSSALEDMYGARGGRGIALRVGRASFEGTFPTLGALRGVSDPAFQALPLAARAQISLTALAAVYSNFSDQQTTLTNETDVLRLEVVNSPFAWGRQADKPVCHALVGVVQECLRWATNGYEFNVQEVACHATGAPRCVFVIQKRPIGQF